MARTKEFDREAVLDRAMRLFWRQGYEATSIQELVDAMAIGRQSLYDTFGDKRALYLAALDRYGATQGAPLFAPLDWPGSAKAAIRAMFDRLIEASLQEGGRGCLTVDAAVERALCDPEVARWVANNMVGGEARLRRTIERGQANGEIDPALDSTAVAQYLFNAVQGLRVTSKVTADRAVLENIVRVTMAILD